MCCDYFARIIFLKEKKPQLLTFPIAGSSLPLWQGAQGEASGKMLPARAMLQALGRRWCKFSCTQQRYCLIFYFISEGHHQQSDFLFVLSLSLPRQRGGKTFICLTVLGV